MHSTEYCTWDDDESIPNDEADALLLAKNPNWEELVRLQRFLENL